MMIPFAKLQHIVKNPKSIYIAFGKDPFMHMTVTDLIAKQLNQVTPHEKISYHCEKIQDLEEQCRAFTQPTLFDEKIFFNIHSELTTLTAAHKSLVHEIANIPSPNTLLLHLPNITYQKIQTISKEPGCYFLNLSPMNTEDMRRWIQQEILKTKRPFPPNAAQIIFQHTENNLMAAKQCFDKIELLHDEAITEVLLYELLACQSTFSLFDLKDALLLGNISKMLSILQELRRDKTESILVLWQFSDELRKLASLSHSMKTMSFGEAAKKANIWSSKYTFYQNALKRLDEKLILSMLNECQQIDLAIKTQEASYTWRMFDGLCVKMGVHTV